MTLRTRIVSLAVLMLVTAAVLVPLARASRTDQTPPWPTDASLAGIRAALHNGGDASQLAPFLPEGAAEAVQSFLAETRALGLAKRATVLYLTGPLNVRANNTAGDRVGETQAEVAVCVFRDTVVIGFNDSQGFLAGNTVSSFAYSTNGGASFTDGGNIPLALPTDQAFGDPGIDTDEQGNWYYNQIYTRAAGAPDPTAEQNIGVHNGRFIGAVLTWNTPVMASIGTSATGNLDKCLLATDRVTGNVYVSYTRFTANPQIEIVRSTTQGATWGAPIVLDNGTTPTSSKQGARPYCGPGGEVYVVWEKGANSIFCPDGAGNIVSFNAQIGFTRSLNFGASYDPVTIIGNPVTDFLAAGPGDLRERGNEFPDIAVDRSSGCYRGNLYVTWHDGASWSANTSAGPVVVESGVNNNNPGTADLFTIGDDVTGSISPAGDLDYWQFSATQGQNLLIDVLPQGFVCGVSGTTRQMRVRLFATQSPYPNPSGFPDSLLAASFIGSFENRIVWTAPRTGTYLIRLQISGGTTTGTYTMRVRPLTFTPGAARDARDVVVVRSSNQGASWSAPQRINDDPAGLENRRPFIAVNNSGQVTAYWHDSRDPGFGSNASLTSIYGTVSRDGGNTWSANFPVTDELSFFSLNTIAVPNLGDYNQASANGTAIFHPAWSDQRLSTGDVRTPNSNTYIAGTGPNAVTTGISFAVGGLCPPDTLAAPGALVTRHFRVVNNGTAPDQYSWSVTDGAGWIVGASSGTTPSVQASSFFDVFVQVQLPLDCNPPSDVLTFQVIPVGEGCYAPQVCHTTVYCDIATATLVSRFEALTAAAGVDLSWASSAVGEVQGWNVYRSVGVDGAWMRLNPDPIGMGSGGEFRFHDAGPPAGEVNYRLTALLPGGREETAGESRLSLGALPFSFAITGRNPFAGSTTLRYTLPRAQQVRVEVYSVTGQKLQTLVNRVETPGAHTVDFALRGTVGSLAPGMYLVRISTGSDRKTVRVVGLE